MAGLYQPISRIDPVSPTPSILTTARPLPSVVAARAGAAALQAIEEKAEFDARVHMASIAQTMGPLRGAGGNNADLLEALDSIVLTLADAKTARAGSGPITVDELYGISDAVWRTGIAWTPIGCQYSFNELRCPAYDVDDAEDRRQAPSEESSVRGEHTDSFTIYTPLVCDWQLVGSRVDDDVAAINDVHTAWGVSRALWLGVGLPDELDQPTLQRAATVTPNGNTAANLDIAIAELLSEFETATGGNGGAVLHVPSIGVVGAIGGIPGGGRVAWPEGNYYRTALGGLMSPGPGYPKGGSPDNSVDGFGPLTDDGPPMKYAGNDTDEFWVFVSGPVEYAVGASTLMSPDEIERRNYGRTNTYDATSQRPAIVRFDTCSVFAAKAINYAGSVS